MDNSMTNSMLPPKEISGQSLCAMGIKQEVTCTQANGGRIIRRFVMTSPYGFYMRAASFFVETVKQYDARVMIGKTSEALVDGKNILGLLTLEIFFGEEVIVLASGSDAPQVIDAITRLFTNAFGQA